MSLLIALMLFIPPFGLGLLVGSVVNNGTYTEK